ncbi:MAG: alternative ribosome rescue aminoacyl-tRNA hydrolase ArfB [Gemmataceae bacterium]
MIEIDPTLRLLDGEYDWKFARSGGPGGQNVNKVASKASLTWKVQGSTQIPDYVKIRLALRHARFFNSDGTLTITSQRFRDQDRNRQDCIEKLAAIVEDARHAPKARKATKPTRGSKERRIDAKKKRAAVKQGRRVQGN